MKCAEWNLQIIHALRWKAHLHACVPEREHCDWNLVTTSTNYIIYKTALWCAPCTFKCASMSVGRLLKQNISFHHAFCLKANVSVTSLLALVRQLYIVCDAARTAVILPIWVIILVQLPHYFLTQCKERMTLDHIHILLFLIWRNGNIVLQAPGRKGMSLTKFQTATRSAQLR